MAQKPSANKEVLRVWAKLTRMLLNAKVLKFGGKWRCGGIQVCGDKVIDNIFRDLLVLTYVIRLDFLCTSRL